MGIYRTNDPTQFDDIDGIVVDESAPPSAISGAAANVAILVAQFQRGPVDLSLPLGSIGEFHEVYGKSSFSGNVQLKNKKFGALRIIRAIASDAAKATLTIDSKIKFDAKYFGAYGDSIEVTVAAGSSIGSKYTIQDTSADAVLPVEIYDDIVIADIVAATFAGSRLVDATVLSTAAEPTPQAATPLAGGSDGSIVDTDYEAAIVYAEEEKAGNVIFLDSYNSTRNGYLKTHVAATQDKMCIVCGDEGDDKAAAIADAANYRDADGRIMYAWPYVQTSIDGALVLTPPAAWVASIFSQTSPHIALSYTGNTGFLAGITDLEYKESRSGYIALNAAGVLSLERDKDVGFLVKNAITTHLVNTEKREVLRRRMADFLTTSIAYYLKNYQNDVNSSAKRDEVKAAILSFDSLLVADKILPGQQDVKGGAPLLVDTESLNTDAVVASGQFRILYKRRIFSSMRFIVLQAEIGTSVVVTEV
jgi:phage tail sheath protein FI